MKMENSLKYGYGKQQMVFKSKNNKQQRLYGLWQELRLWHVLFILGFVKVTNGNVK